MHLAVIFANFGGYHLVRLRAAEQACRQQGWDFTGIQITNAQNEHVWGQLDENGFRSETVIHRSEDQGSLTVAEKRQSGARLVDVLERIQPTAVAIPGWGFSYSRAALGWCGRRRAHAVLMSESKRNDEPRVWLKEWIKSRLYVHRFQAAIVGAAAHRDYLVELGLPTERIFFGYDVVDNSYFASKAEAARKNPGATRARQPAIPPGPYFIAVTRFIPRKNVARLIEAYANYRAMTGAAQAWDLVICGSGICEHEIRAAITTRELTGFVHLPGFIPYSAMGDWYGLAAAFIHPAIQEQWGLVVNEAMAAGLPVLVSNRCGCYSELVADHGTGIGFDPESVGEMTAAMLKVSVSPEFRNQTATTAARHIGGFAPEHFGRGMVDAVKAAARERA